MTNSESFQTIYFFSSRFPLNYISKHAPLDIRMAYSFYMDLIGLSVKEVDIDKEDWIESVIPLLTLIKEDIEEQEVFIYGKTSKGEEVRQFLESNTAERKINLLLIGLFIDPQKVYDCFPQSYVNMLFPTASKFSYEEVNYPRLKAFNSKANRHIYGFASTVDNEQIRFLERFLKYVETGESKSENETNYFRDLMDKPNYSLESIKKEIELAEDCRINQFEDVLHKLSYLQKEDIKQYFIKTIEKKWAHSFEIKKNSEEKDIYSSIIDVLDYEYIERTKTRKNALLIQDFAKMEYEYRFIVIDKEIICGAGCVENHTPIDSSELKFDLKVEKDRNCGNVEEREDIVFNYITLAHLIVKEIAEEDPGFENYTLDMGMINGEPGIIEINPYKNVGFYALDYRYIIRKLKSKVKKGEY